jgi:hypothetical protein
MALTAFVAISLGAKRVRAATSGTVDPHYYELFRGEDGEPDHIRKYTRHLSNLFEVPLLFYALTLIAHASGQTGTLIVSLCWAFAMARLIHSVIHLSSNDVLSRFKVFAVSWMILLALLISVAVGLIRSM